MGKIIIGFFFLIKNFLAQLDVR